MGKSLISHPRLNGDFHWGNPIWMSGLSLSGRQGAVPQKASHLSLILCKTLITQPSATWAKPRKLPTNPTSSELEARHSPAEQRRSDKRWRTAPGGNSELHSEY